MKKRLLSILLALCMSPTLLSGTAWASIEDGLVDLKLTNELRWIDRVELPDYALTLYKTLEEAADGDGYKDYLIDDKYYDLEGDDIFTDVPGEFMRGTVTSSDKGGTTRYTAILVTTTKKDETDQNTRYYIANCIRTVVSAFWRDHSEVFWTHGIYRIEINRNGTKYYCLALCADYSAPKEEDSTYYEIRIEDFRSDGKWDIRRAMARQDADIETILSSIPTGADRFTQIYYINDWLAENNGYNTIVSKWLAGQSGKVTGVPNGVKYPWYTKSITALDGREGVEGPDCGGYASAVKVLCDTLDIPCVNVHGTTASGRSHRWDYVQMEDGNWYAIDSCYNDNSKDRTRYLLVGAQTVVNKVKFIENHIETNPAYYGGVESFINGPTLNDEAYPRNVHLAYWGLPETLTLGDSITMTPVLIFASDADYTYSSTLLPEGLTVNPDTGEITGTITDDAEIFNVTVTATNPTNPADAARCTLEFSLASSLPYADVARSDWYYRAVVWAAKNSVTYGKSETKFGPNDTVTRGQAVTFLWRAMGEPEPSNAHNPFNDVAKKDYYYKAVLWAVEQGITAGTSPTAFSPQQTCSYGHILTFLWRTSGTPNETGEGVWYNDALVWAANEGLIDPNRAVTNPDGDCSRADVVAYLWRKLAIPTSKNY